MVCRSATPLPHRARYRSCSPKKLRVPIKVCICCWLKIKKPYWLEHCQSELHVQNKQLFDDRLEPYYSLLDFPLDQIGRGALVARYAGWDRLNRHREAYGMTWIGPASVNEVWRWTLLRLPCFGWPAPPPLTFRVIIYGYRLRLSLYIVFTFSKVELPPSSRPRPAHLPPFFSRG